jgi:hypothetical protein
LKIQGENISKFIGTGFALGTSKQSKKSKRGAKTMEDRHETFEAPVPTYLRAGDEINVRALLVARNIKQVDIAERYNFGRAEVNKVINGKRKTLRIREAIASELGMSVDELWGQRR